MSTPDTGPSAVKAAARAQARARRRMGPAPDPDLLARRALDLVRSLPGAMRVTCYASYGTEPPTEAMRSVLTASGFEVLLPRVVDDRMDWVVADEVMTVSDMGIAEPAGPPVALLPVRALLIPALAVTAHGDRLGKGGGFYDRALAALGDECPAIIAVVGDADVVDDVPTQEHDRRVDFIITPSRVITCGSRLG